LNCSRLSGNFFPSWTPIGAAFKRTSVPILTFVCFSGRFRSAPPPKKAARSSTHHQIQAFCIFVFGRRSDTEKAPQERPKSTPSTLLGRSWGALGRSWGALWASLGALWSLLGALGPFLAALGALLDVLGALWGRSWALLGRPGVGLGHPSGALGLPLAALRPFLAIVLFQTPLERAWCSLGLDNYLTASYQLATTKRQPLAPG